MHGTTRASTPRQRREGVATGRGVTLSRDCGRFALPLRAKMMEPAPPTLRNDTSKQWQPQVPPRKDLHCRHKVNPIRQMPEEVGPIRADREAEEWLDKEKRVEDVHQQPWPEIHIRSLSRKPVCGRHAMRPELISAGRHTAWRLTAPPAPPFLRKEPIANQQQSLMRLQNQPAPTRPHMDTNKNKTNCEWGAWCKKMRL